MRSHLLRVRSGWGARGAACFVSMAASPQSLARQALALFKDMLSCPSLCFEMGASGGTPRPEGVAGGVLRRARGPRAHLVVGQPPAPVDLLPAREGAS